MIRSLCAAVGLALLLAPAASVAQTAPPTLGQPSPSPAPQPSPSPPSAFFPALGTNDPCTSIAAIVTRPTVSNSICTVRPNHVLIETGYQNTTAAGSGGNSVAYPQMLIRVGTRLPALEFDLAPPSLMRTNAGSVMTGTTDAGAGLKYVFGYSPKFNYGGQVFVTAPTGLNGFSAGGAQTTYGLQGSYTLSPAFSLAGVAQFASLSNGAARWSSVIPSLVLSATLPSNTGLFAEIAQFSHATGPGTPTRTQYILGAYRDVGQQIQLDASIGISPTNATGRYHYLGVGFSYYR